MRFWADVARAEWQLPDDLPANGHGKRPGGGGVALLFFHDGPETFTSTGAMFVEGLGDDGDAAIIGDYAWRIAWSCLAPHWRGQLLIARAEGLVKKVLGGRVKL